MKGSKKARSELLFTLAYFFCAFLSVLLCLFAPSIGILIFQIVYQLFALFLLYVLVQKHHL